MGFLLSSSEGEVMCISVIRIEYGGVLTDFYTLVQL